MTYSIDIINLCIRHYYNGEKINNISKIIDVSVTNIYNWIHKYFNNFNNGIYITDSEFKIIKDIKLKQHKSNKTNKYEELICNYVNNNQGCSLNDILSNNPSVKLSKSFICRILKKNNISHKRFKTRIIPRNITEIENNRRVIANSFTNEEFLNMISIDESSIRIDDLTNYGYSLRGVEIKKTAKHKNNKKRLTLLKAISSNEIIGYKIFEKTVNAQVYLDFLTEIRNSITGKTILHDNVRFHHSKIVKNYCNENNIGLKYTSAYSPEFNPIETVFGQIKMNYKKLTHENMIEDIRTSINSLIPENFINHYNKSLEFISTYRN